MARVVNCPQCQAALSLPEEVIGKQVRCPKCAEVFTAPADVPPPPPVATPGTILPGAPPPLPPTFSEPLPPRHAARDERDDEDYRPRRTFDDRDDGDDDYERRRPWREDYERRDRLDPSWRTVQGGLNTMFFSSLFGTILPIIFLVVMFIVGMMIGVQGAQRNQGPPPQFIILIGGSLCVLGLGILAVIIAYLIGAFMCLAAPQGKEWIAGHLIGLGLYVLVYVITLFVAFQAQRQRDLVGNAGRMELVLQIVQQSVALGLGVCLTLFWRRIGTYFSDSSLVFGCHGFLVFQILFSLAMIGVVVYVHQSGLMRILRQGPAAAGNLNLAQIGVTFIVIGLAIILACIGYLIWFIVLVRSARNTIYRAFVD